MEWFYLAVRATGRQYEFVISKYDYFKYVQKELNLPYIGFLLVPRKDLIHIATQYPDVPMALDNGAFQFLKSTNLDLHVDINDTMVTKWFENLNKAQRAREWHFVALPDIPVHGKRFVPALERLHRIELTFKLHEWYLTKYDYNRVLRPVLQGFTPHEYHVSFYLFLEHLDLSRLNPVLAVGSVCVRKNSSLTYLADGKARGNMDFMEPLLNSKELYRYQKGLHFFGLHGRFVKKWKDHPRFYSSDSGAAGSVFKYEIKDILRRLRLNIDDQNVRYLIANLVQYVRSTSGMDQKAWEVIASLF